MHASQATHATYGNGEPDILAHPSPLPHPCCRKGKIENLTAFLTKQRIGQKLQVRCQCKVTANVMPTCDKADQGNKEQFQRSHHGSKQIWTAPPAHTSVNTPFAAGLSCQTIPRRTHLEVPSGYLPQDLTSRPPNPHCS